MLLRPLGLALMIGLSALAPAGLRAETAAAAVPDLSAVLQLDAVVGVLREEGLAGAADIATGFADGEGGPGWHAAVERIYDPARMQQIVGQGLAAGMAGAPEAAAGARAFFSTPLGARVLQLEVAARRTLLDPDAEAAARYRWEDMQRADGARARLIRRFAEVNDLVEANVAGTMNSNLAFYQGLAVAGGPMDGLSEEDMLSMVRGDEDATRASTIEWLFPFLALAYEPLSDDELQRYIDFSDSAAGRKVNGAMFAAFDALFVGISRDLGRAAALEMAGQDI